MCNLIFCPVQLLLVILSHDEELSLNNLYGLDVIISQLHVWHITLEKIIYKSRNV